MTFLEILDTLLIGPLKLIFELIFKLTTEITNNLGVCIALLSLIINLMILPLYMCADAMQERAQKREAELAPSIKHIKATFKGDERMMMLQTFYKQNHYSPLSALSGAVSLLLEIPFFIAAYTFLSGVAEFQGAGFGPITDLSKPDGLLTIGSLTINLLPFIMTLFNIIASALFLKGAPLKAKIQLYAMAVFFLVFLYTSPAGLLFYWTLNNLFSLIKNVFYKLKHPRTVLAFLVSIIGILIPVMLFALEVSTVLVRLLTLIITAVCQIPLVIYLLKKSGRLSATGKVYVPNKRVFVLGAVFISALLGILIPTACIASSAIEFKVSDSVHPLWYVVSSACLAFGTFCIWLGVFYWLCSPRGKVVFEKVVWIMAVIMFVNYMFFGKNLGNMSANLQYDNGVNYSTLETTINILVILSLAVATFFIITKFKTVVIGVLALAIGAVGTMSTINLIDTASQLNSADTSTSSSALPYFNLSKSNKNVVFIMLDRAKGDYLPYILKEKPELQEYFSGFTYYSNVISFGGSTNYASPALLGGYEYTPVEMNRKSDQSLAEKQNEANLVIPRILTENEWDNGLGASAKIFEPMYTNYTFVGDLSVFEPYDKISASNILGKFVDDTQKQAIARNNFRNFFCFSFMKTMTLPLQFLLYNNGTYNKVFSIEDQENNFYSIQVSDGVSTSSGIRSEFMDSYNNLANLATMTKIIEGEADKENTYTFMCNNTTHEPMLLDANNNYAPAMSIDNTLYDQQNADRFNIDGRTLNISSAYQMQSYHVNISSLLRIGEWLEYLKANGVYDNTRIIIAADHGASLGTTSELYHSNANISADGVFPLLMVKDFNSTTEGITFNDDFMTNADVPLLATQGVVANAVNPATGVVLSDSEKTAHPQYITLGIEWSIYINNGNTFDKTAWVSVDNTDGKGSIWNAEDWSYYGEKVALDKHSFD